MPGVKATPGVGAHKDGTRGAGGIVDSRLSFQIVGALHIPLFRVTRGIVGHRFGRITMLLLTAPPLVPQRYQRSTDREIPVVVLEPIKP